MICIASYANYNNNPNTNPSTNPSINHNNKNKNNQNIKNNNAWMRMQKNGTFQQLSAQGFVESVERL